MRRNGELRFNPVWERPLPAGLAFDGVQFVLRNNGITGKLDVRLLLQNKVVVSNTLSRAGGAGGAPAVAKVDPAAPGSLDGFWKLTRPTRS